MTRCIAPVTLEGLCHAELLAMRDAGDELLACYRDLDTRGSHLVEELLGEAPFEDERHLPPDEVRDPRSGAQYYFHAHLDGELGHFHTYGRAAADGAPAHLVGVSVDDRGLPTRLFVTERWATGGGWCHVAELPALLARFTFDAAPRYTANRVLPALLRLFRPEVEALFAARGDAPNDAPGTEETRVLVAVEVCIDTRRAAVESLLARAA